MVDNRRMNASLLRAFLPSTLRALVVAAVALACIPADAAKPPAPGSLREQFPEGSIDSADRADAALAATSGVRARIEKEYRDDARECAKAFLVNDCLDKARELQRARLADVGGVELEANRMKRRDKADRLEADRARRDAERKTNASTDDAQRARNRQTFDERQAQAAREAAARGRKDQRPASAHKPAIRVPPAPNTATNTAQREKNAAAYATKVQEAEAHKKDVARRLASKAADRKRRADEKAAKDAKNAVAAAGPQPLR
jgi:colicin import membrane protein